MNNPIKENRSELANRTQIVFQHDNTRQHSSLVTRQKLLEFGWDLLPHPPYSPDLAPSYYHLFRFLQNFLDGNVRDVLNFYYVVLMLFLKIFKL